MTDPITRARKEWCEATVSSDFAPVRQAWDYVVPCPPEVVAALLDALEDYLSTCDSRECVTPCCQTPSYKPHQPTCVLVLAEAAIARALEEK